MPKIVETIVTTADPEGTPHLAPLGLIETEGGWTIAPFRPSRTLDNLLRVPYAVANHTDDVRIYAGCLTGRRDWPLYPAEKVRGYRLKAALAHWELMVARTEDDEVRPRFHCRIIHFGQHAPWAGFNRAQNAVIEAAVLVSRLDLLPREKIETELAHLSAAVEKTAGVLEQEAWDWLMQRVAVWQRGEEGIKTSTPGTGDLP